MTHATATLTTQAAIARGRQARSAAFARLLAWANPFHAARPAMEVTA
ncbi:hypothetical protein PVW48_08380 [Dinoroseobacter sp. PD6]|nr:hypothetical protein [Dinoroseobacter sp. PD6]MDD9716756.1 hypothetical protein [Dinoroseobacter sp. PD6]